MLESLYIKNVALIDVAEINFKRGLNVMSGETGSGKSVILEALNFVLGAKADKTLIRSGESECFVRAEFSLENDFLNAVFEEADYEKDSTLIITRRLNSDGKSVIKINGNVANQSILKKFTSKLVDVHGQSEHFYLLKNSNQRELIDKFGGEKVAKIKNELKEIFKEYKKISAEISSLGGSESDRLVKIDILNYQTEEIKNADLKDGEEEELLKLKSAISNQEKILTVLNSVKNGLCGEGGADDAVSNADRQMAGISLYGEEYSKISERLSALKIELSDISDAVSSLAEDFGTIDIDPDKVEERLDLIKKLKRKYGGSVKEILGFAENAEKEREKLLNFNELYAGLIEQKSETEKKIYQLYGSLSAARKSAAKDFADKVLAELKELGMQNAGFSVKFSDFPKLSECNFTQENGADDLEFTFSANQGEPEKPLSAVISGGEISRFMLAIKTQTAKFNNVSTFIFDEIDAGISGNTAKVVAKKFAKISSFAQIIAITHLPQISAMGDNNLYIEKTVAHEKTLTSVKELDGEGKIQEILRLTGGDENSVFARQLAKELIEESTEYKRQILK